MSNKSDHTKPQHDITQYLPEVYKSEVSESVFETSFNRHLTKDDTTRVTGFVGDKNSQALVNRQIVEQTPHRQLYQLAPTMYTKLGTRETSLSFQAFRTQLELMGVDFTLFPEWGNAVQFNWVPPVNIDMLVNYSNYFWAPDNQQDAAQYITVENKCRRARSKATAYENVIATRGTSFASTSVNLSTDALTISGKYDDLFVDGFVFYLTGSAYAALNSRYVTVASSSYSSSTNATTITLVEQLATVSSTAPSSPTTNLLWYDSSTSNAYVWSGSAWVAVTSSKVSVTLSLAEMLSVYQAAANCACSSDTGWDTSPWDDNQIGSVIWNTSLLTAISHSTEAEWEAVNGTPSENQIWYDTTTDTLKQYVSGSWVTATASFSEVAAKTTGVATWDMTTSCIVDADLSWSEQNRWIHKSEIKSYANARRAALPILEYDSDVELNQWVEDTPTWKYRTSSDGTFATSDVEPSRLELEPIIGYTATNTDGVWYITLYDQTISVERDVDYTSLFVPGFVFRVTDDAYTSSLYTVATCEYVENSDGQMVTVVSLVEVNFNSSLQGGGTLNTRIEPLVTTHGDTWRGYHVHWLLSERATSTTPVSPQAWNTFRRRDTSTSPVITDILSGSVIQALTSTYQEWTVQVTGITTVVLDATLTPTTQGAHFATAGGSDLRVYVNGVRQYGNYTETTATIQPTYTSVGFSTYTTVPVTYVTGITFDSAISQFDVVRIEVGCAARADMGRAAIPVRTVEDETEFATQLLAGTQPVYMSLSKYRLVEQTKTLTNQYPMFNVYNVLTGKVLDASQIFGYAESADYSVNTSVQRRIVASSDGKEYTFEQYLLDSDDNLLYGYRSTSGLISPSTTVPTPRQWWYNTVSSTLYGWDGKAWTSSVEVPSGSVTAIRTPIVATTAPSSPKFYDIWYNASTNLLYRYNGTSWVSYPTTISGTTTSTVHVGADPSLQTIWKPGTNLEEFVPEYVDSTGTAVTVGDASGDWQLSDQWRYNPEHRNRSQVKYTELFTHFNSILTQQTRTPGLPTDSLFTLTQSEYNYGLGGTIKEYNDSFDTLISAVNVSSITPISVIEFAETQYAVALQTIKDLFAKHMATLLSTYTSASIVNQAEYIASYVIALYAANEFLTQTFGDTSAYDKSSSVGIQNWIASAPMFGLAPKYVPHVVEGTSFTEVYHHDGHRSQISVSAAEVDRYARLLATLTDSRAGTFATVSTASPPATPSAFLASVGSTMRTGVYWYQTGTDRALYRFQMYAMQDTAPSLVYNSSTLPDGVMYYNTTTQAVYEVQDSEWVRITDIDSADISPLWVAIDLEVMLANVILTIEQQLYDVSPDYSSLKFDYDSLSATTAGATAYAASDRSRFDAFVNVMNIKSPLVNTTYSATDAFTWNYVTSSVYVPPYEITTTRTEPTAQSCWQSLYTAWYGTPYPHLEPWVLQGFSDKPTWWDTTYKDATGARRWSYVHSTQTGMWANILNGIVPSGQSLPSGVTSTGAAGEVNTYSYVSVNISDSSIGGYAPDEVLPPYFDNTVGGTVTADTQVRSLFAYLAHVSAVDADYAFGDGGPNEWKWRTSIRRAYDKMAIAFMMQPVRFMHAAFGPEFVEVNSLQVETTFNHVYSHVNALFHGDLYNTNDVYKSRGLNQWYVNYNRYSGLDTNSQFREEWVNWTPKLTYQMAGIVDTSTLSATSRYFDIGSQDYDVILVNEGVLRDAWIDAFEISVLSIPPKLIQYNSQSKWKLELNTLASVTRTLTYYGVKSYPCFIDRSTDAVYAYRYAIEDVSRDSYRFYVPGDQTFSFTEGKTFTVAGSTANDGTYTVVSSVYELSADRTRITVGTVISSDVVDGYIDLSTTISSWALGDRVVVASTRVLPSPLKPNVPYYIIPVSTNSYRLAETYNDAISGMYIDVASYGEGEFTISEIDTTFYVHGGTGNTSDLWFHYAIDTTDVRTITPPTTFYGMQTLINIIDGYVAYQQAQGILYNPSDVGERDPDTGRNVSWQVEQERFINWAFGLHAARLSINDKYQVSADVSANTLTFSSASPTWSDGTGVVFSTTGTLPSPLIAGTQYYVRTTDTDGVFKVSVTRASYDDTYVVNLTSTGTGTIYVSAFSKQVGLPTFEMNPTRNNICLSTPTGVLSNVVDGPYADIRVQQTIFDQYSRPIVPSNLLVYRRDKSSRVSIMSSLPNDIDTAVDSYGYLHMGGAHLFVEGYEHYLLFENYTTDGSLIYDPFLGLRANRISMDYYEKNDYTLRPTLGGYYMLDGKFYRNIEGAVSDTRDCFSPYGVNSTETERRARAMVGYTGTSTWLDQLNVNDKSQFTFYRGMLQSKGSMNSVAAYINSRRFVDAKLDEFWAWKLAEFGDARARKYPEIKLFTSDGLIDDIRLEFLATSELDSDPDVLADVAEGFRTVSFRDKTRWANFPEQKQDLGSALFLDAEASDMVVLYAGSDEPPATYSAWYHTDTGVYQERVDGAWTTVTDKLVLRGDYVYYKLSSPSDSVRVIRRTMGTTGSSTDFSTYTTQMLTEGTGINEYMRINTEIVRMNAEGFYGAIVLFTINPAKRKISPVELVDNAANTVLKHVPLWHPAYGIHQYIAEENIDVMQDDDPALYSVSLMPSNISTRPWNATEAGKVWVDTSSLGYMPYYDDVLYPNVNDRLYEWGKLAPWAETHAYVWTSSAVPPASWATQVTSDAANADIEQNSKATGSARKTTFKRVRSAIAGATVDASTSVFTLPTGSTVSDGQIVLFTTTETLPTGIDASVKYTVVAVTSSTFTLTDADGNAITVSDAGSGTLTVVPAFTADSWKRQPVLCERLHTPFIVAGSYPIAVTSLPLTDSGWSVGDTVSVYINGVLAESDIELTSATSVSISITLKDSDLIDVVRPVYSVTDTDLEFDPDTTDDGTTMIQWKTDYEYTSVTTIGGTTTTGEQSSTVYYFWVESSTNYDETDRNAISVAEVASLLATNSTPYFIVQQPKDDPSLAEMYGYGMASYGESFSMGDIAEQFYVVPVLYRQAVIRNIAAYITNDDRFILRFLRDLTLRDNIAANGKQMNLKDKHEEWYLFRKEQTSSIPTELWNRLTEAMMGCTIDDNTVRVPSLERELYDASYNTDTRFGLGVDQAFVDKTMAIATITSYLKNPSNDFYPVDIDDFWSRNSFDTAASTYAAMTEIYNSFTSTHVNAMWFETLYDALTTRAKYKELMKTSWIALHGIRVLEVGGMFDD